MTDQPELPLDPDQPETNPDFERIFGQGGSQQTPPSGAYEPIEFDPSEAGTGFVRLPEGDYEAMVSEPPEKQISQNNNPMMKVVYMVTEDAFLGKLQWARYMLSGVMTDKTKQFLEAVGLFEEAEGKKPIQPLDVDKRRVVISVRPQKKNTEYDEVWKVRPHPDGPLP